MLFPCCVVSLPQVHLRLDTSLEQDKLPVQGFISRSLALGEWTAGAVAAAAVAAAGCGSFSQQLGTEQQQSH